MTGPSRALLAALGVLLTALLAASRVAAGLLPLADNLNVESTVIVRDVDTDRTGLLRVEEFMSRLEGSLKVSVVDVSESEQGKNKQDYFRLLEHEPLGEQHAAHPDNRLLTYDHKLNRCTQETTNIWQLGDYSRLLDDLYATSEQILRSEALARDRTAIGPAALLRLVYDNSERFTYETKSFDQLHLTDAYYFTLRFALPLDNPANPREAKLVVVVASHHVDTEAHDGELLAKLKLGKTRLSELSALGHVTAVGLVALNGPQADPRDGEPRASYLDLRAPELLDWASNPLPVHTTGLIVSYQLVQERTLSQHLGADESIFDLFSLPAGIGCGYVSAHRPVYLTRARQFSGAFETLDQPGAQFAAFDELSQHFRFDDSGDGDGREESRKLIYSLKDTFVTLVRPTGYKPATIEATSTPMSSSNDSQAQPGATGSRGDDEFLSQQAQVAQSNAGHEYQTHCAQTSLADERDLLGLKSMSDVLGAGGERVGLMYLGSRRLESRDQLSLRVHVYEREISHAQIPLLVRLSLRARPRPATMTKYTLVFYFVDEAFDSLAADAAPSFESATPTHNSSRPVPVLEDTMWLKRLELVSSNSIMKFQSLEARLTFSRFSWSLASAGEETRERLFKVLHPSRTFDLAECWPARTHTHLDALLELSPTRAVRLDGGVSPRETKPPIVHLETRGDYRSVEQMESLEEALFGFLVSQIEFPRAFVSDFELVDEASVAPSDGDDDDEFSTQANESNTTSLVLMRAKLTNPFNYYYNSQYLVGWVRSLPALLHARQAELVVRKLAMPAHECVLVLATRWATLRASSFYMLQCPLLGCGHLNTSVTKLDSLADFVHERDRPSPAVTPDNYNDMCEVHLIRRSFAATALVSERFRPERVEPKLRAAKVALQTSYFGPPGAAGPQLLAGQIRQVSLEKGPEADMRDEQLLSGLCFNLQTRLERKLYPNQTSAQATMEHKFLELEPFDGHHSRIHCHRACMLYAFCNSYSWSAKRRACTLSDVTPEQVRDPTVRMDQNRPYDCTIHALQQVGQFKRRPYIVFSRPCDLVRRNDSAVLGLSLEACARLCRRNELVLQQQPGGEHAAAIACETFNYMRSNSLCILEPGTRRALAAELERDKQQVNWLTTLSDLETYLGRGREGADRAKGRASESEAHESFKRDYTQHYSVVHSAGLELRQPTGVPQVESALVQMRDLDLTECARECTILRRACLAFDHCSSTIAGRYTNLCHLYEIRAPLTVPGMDKDNKLTSASKLAGQLTSLEQRFYLANVSDVYQVALERKDHCTHYYLDGDGLYLKRKLAMAPRNAAGEADRPLLEGLEHELQARSEGQQAAEQQSGLHQSEFHQAHEESHTSSGSLSFGELCAQMLAGAVLGALVFAAQPKLGRLASEWGLSEMLANVWERRPGARTERSLSRVEITEMMDIH